MGCMKSSITNLNRGLDDSQLELGHRLVICQPHWMGQGENTNLKMEMARVTLKRHSTESFSKFFHYKERLLMYVPQKCANHSIYLEYESVHWRDVIFILKSRKTEIPRANYILITIIYIYTPRSDWLTTVGGRQVSYVWRHQCEIYMSWMASQWRNPPPVTSSDDAIQLSISPAVRHLRLGWMNNLAF